MRANRAFLVVALSPVVGFAQPPDKAEAPAEDATALAKQTQNPVADLISIPIQMNFNSGGDLGDETNIAINVQPVIPIHVTPEWNVIARTIVPISSVSQPDGNNDSGLGDIVLELFVSPGKPGALVWGVGPILSFPTATLDPLETGSWGVGPAAVALYTDGPWVVGALATQTWTIADYGDARDVNTFLVQPFVNYNFGRGWAAVSAPIITANWNADDNGWVVPLGAGLAWTTKVGGQPMNLGVHYYRNVASTPASGDNQLRLQVSFLFPEKKPATAATAQTATR
jgi:hypothetical protein